MTTSTRSKEAPNGLNRSTLGPYQTWLAANAPEIAKALPPGVTDEEIRQVEATMEGLLLPEDVKASYRRHNGYYSGSFLMNQSIFFQLEGLYLGQARLENLYGKVLQRTPAYLSGPIQPVWRHPAWLNLTSNGAGDYWCVDLAPAPGGQVAQIISFSHEVGPERVIAPSLQALLATLADELEAGKYVVAGLNITEEQYIWKPEHRTRSNWERVREHTEPASPLISTRALIKSDDFADAINTLYREVRAYLDQHGIPLRIDHTLTVLARYEQAPNGQLELEVGIAVTEARSDDPRMLVGTLPNGTSAMLPQICYRRLPRIIDSEEFDRQLRGPADPRLIGEEGFAALEEWSAHHQQPLTGQPWLIFWVSPDNPEDVPVTEPVVRFDVHRLLESSASLKQSL